eukprot:PLAT1061.1.p1 GENE.PLAT1061.1~~PLAT1061.1.p1  ORF type:complete len:251 (-),score=124.51 PLAT1061.1:217-969(-)
MASTLEKVLLVVATLLPTILVIIWEGATLAPPFGSFALKTEMPYAWQFLNFHPLLMTAAFTLFFGWAIVAFKVLPYDHATKKAFHFCCQAVAWVLSTLAVICMFMFKSATQNGNLYTVHAWAGFATYIGFSVQFWCGLYAFYWPKLQPASRRAAFVNWHRHFGVALFIGTTASIVSGLQDRQWLYKFANVPAAKAHGGAFTLANLIGFAVLALATLVMFYHVKLRGATSSAAKTDSSGLKDSLLEKDTTA